MKSAEQKARDLLEQCGVDNAQSFSAGDVVSLANFISDNSRDCAKLNRIRELHSPTPIPEGNTWMGARKDHPEDAPCEGCATGDPYLDQTWPCATRQICDE